MTPLKKVPFNRMCPGEGGRRGFSDPTTQEKGIVASPYILIKTFPSKDLLYKFFIMFVGGDAIIVKLKNDVRN